MAAAASRRDLENVRPTAAAIAFPRRTRHTHARTHARRTTREGGTGAGRGGEEWYERERLLHTVPRTYTMATLSHTAFVVVVVFVVFLPPELIRLVSPAAPGRFVPRYAASSVHNINYRARACFYVMHCVRVCTYARAHTRSFIR